MAESSEDSLIGKKLGPYRIDATMASGAMGEVFLGTHEALQRRVAIKTLKASVASDREAVERFFAEARAVNVIRHENIVECTDFVYDPDERSYMVMELLEGRTLRQAISDGGPMNPARAVRIAAQIADAMEAAHDKGIVHRDLKPANIFLIRRAGSDDYVKVLDFGIARLRPDLGGIDATQTGVLIGTPAFMSPEQVEGSRVGPSSDIYSLGVILFAMLAGRLPFEGTTSLEMMMGHQSDEPPHLSSVGVPPALADLVARTLRKRPEQRPASMAQLRDEMLGSVGGNATTPSASGHEASHAGSISLTSGPTTSATAGSDESPIATDMTLLGSEANDTEDESIATEPTMWGTGPAEDSDQERLTVAADTVKTPGRGRAPLLAVMLTLVIASVIALLVLRGQGQKQHRGAAPPAPPAEQPAEMSAVADRNELDDLLRSGHREPLAPTSCRTTSPDALASLKDAAEELRGGAPGGARPGDRRALELLAAAGAPSGPAPEYWHLLAKARLYVGEDPSSVLAAAGNALEQCAEYAAAHQVAGTASFLADRNADAQRFFSRAIELAPNFSRARFNLGLVQLADQRVQPAIESFSWVLEREPRDPDALIARGQAYLFAREAALAVQDLELAVELRASRGDVHLLLGLAYGKLGRTADATRSLCTGRDLGNARAAELCRE